MQECCDVVAFLQVSWRVQSTAPRRMLPRPWFHQLVPNKGTVRGTAGATGLGSTASSVPLSVSSTEALHRKL